MATLPWNVVVASSCQRILVAARLTGRARGVVLRHVESVSQPGNRVRAQRPCQGEFLRFELLRQAAETASQNEVGIETGSMEVRKSAAAVSEGERAAGQRDRGRETGCCQLQCTDCPARRDLPLFRVVDGPYETQGAQVEVAGQLLDLLKSLSCAIKGGQPRIKFIQHQRGGSGMQVEFKGLLPADTAGDGGELRLADAALQGFDVRAVFRKGELAVDESRSAAAPPGRLAERLKSVTSSGP